MHRKELEERGKRKIDWKKYKELGSGYASGLSMDDLDDRNLIRAIEPIVGAYILFSEDVKFSSVEQVTLAAADVAKRNRLDPQSLLFADSLVRAWREFRSGVSRAINDFVRGKSGAAELIEAAVSPARDLLEGRLLN